MAMPNSYQQYKTQSISTMTPGELLIILFDELVKRAKQGEIAIKAGNVEGANDSLMRAQDIVRYLTATLNDDYEITKEIKPLYDFFYQQLVMANTKKNADILEALIPMLEDMRETWKQSERLTHKN